MASLTSKSARLRLVIRRNPYFLKLADGCHLGFRRGPDTWIARYRDRTGKMHFHALGSTEEFSEAKERAEHWLAQMKGTGSAIIRRGTVRDALQAYVRDVREEQGRATTAEGMDRIFRRAVYSDPIAELELRELTREEFRAWRKRLVSHGHHRVPLETKQNALRRLAAGEDIHALCAEYGVHVNTIRVWRREGIKRISALLPQTVNRITAAVRAGLNYAIEELGYVGTRESWQVSQLPPQEAAARSFLNPAQRRHLMQHAGASIRDFLQGLEETGARPGELARAKVSHFDVRFGRLTFTDRKGKHRLNPRVRQTILSSTGAAFFKAMTKGKLPGAPLLMSPEGGHWQQGEWAAEIRDAVIAANKGRAAGDPLRLPADTRAYSFRHARISELLQVYKVDPLTVCKMTGTSLEMLRQHYWHLIADQMREALDAVKEA